MHRVLHATIMLAALALAGCATGPTSPAYGPAKSATGIGYSDKPISLTQYFVTYRAPVQAGAQTTENLALLRAADLTLEKGHPWFRLISRRTEQGSVMTQHHVRANTTTQNMQCGLKELGCSYSGSINDVAGANVNTTASYQRQIFCILQIEIGSGPKPQGSNVYDAKSTAAKLRATVSKP